MRIVIEHDITKREIIGPFNICGSAEDLKAIAQAITQGLQNSPSFSYGWVEVTDAPNKRNINTQPVGWNDTKTGS